MNKPATSIDFTCEWFAKAADAANKQNRRDSAALWNDGLSHLKYQQRRINELEDALRCVTSAIRDIRHDLGANFPALSEAAILAEAMLVKG